MSVISSMPGPHVIESLNQHYHQRTQTQQPWRKIAADARAVEMEWSLDGNPWEVMAVFDEEDRMIAFEVIITTDGENWLSWDSVWGWFLGEKGH